MNNEFNVELAKCGRIVKATKVDDVLNQEVFYAKLVEPVGDWGYFAKCGAKNGNINFLFDASYYICDDETVSDYRIIGMATDEECRAAGIEQSVDVVESLKKRITELELCLDDVFNGLEYAAEDIERWGNFCDEEIQRNHNLDRDVAYYKKIADKVDSVISKGL